MTQIIERLKTEKEESEKRIVETAGEEGLRWAKKASYDDLQFVLNWDVSEYPGREDIEAEVLGEYFHDLFTEYSQLNYNNDQYSGCWVDDRTLAFLEGWHEAVVKFWDEIKDKI